MLKKLTTIFTIGFILVTGIMVASLIYVYISGGSGEASEPISAPTLDVAEIVPEDQAGTPALFRIVQEESEVRFELDEELRGMPQHVVGRTNEVAGDILIDVGNPANTTLGTIRINLRTLATNNEFRNRAIRSQILESQKDEYEFTDFVPTSIDGLPENVEVGQPFTFTVTGDLTIKDITKSVAFEVTVNPVSEDRIEGAAVAQVLRSDYGLEIPNVPGVANVTNEVSLQIDFVAVRVTDE